MTDRELLEAAAKAAGLFSQGDETSRYGHFMGLSIRQDDNPSGYRWNPLTDDGDALRLAVNLRLEVNCTIPDKPTISVYGNNQGRMVAAHEDKTRDPYAATRRAIVRAAAAMVLRD